MSEYLGVYKAIVVDNDDPEGLYRVTCLIPHVLADALSNWCEPTQRTRSVPSIGQTIWVSFLNGNPDEPVYTPTPETEIEPGSITETEIADYAVTARKLWSIRHNVYNDNNRAPSLTENDPANGSIAWESFHIGFDGNTYDVPAGNTSHKFVYWIFGQGITTSDTLPELSSNDVLLFLNKDGVPVNVQTASTLDGSLIVPGTIIAEALVVDTLVVGGNLVNFAPNYDPSTKIRTYYQSSPPSASTVGDVWYDTDDKNKPYRWSGASWEPVRDGAIADAASAAAAADAAADAAMTAAQTAQSTADGIVETFYTESAPGSPSVGDRWFRNSDAAGFVWDGSTWQTAPNAVTTAMQSAQAAQSTADGKISSYYSDTAPATANPGDLWYDTNDKNKPYYWDSGWVSLRDGTIADAAAAASTANTAAQSALTAAQAAQATADGAIRTYYQSSPPWADGTTQPDSVLGDLWYDLDTDVAHRWNGLEWKVIQDSTISEALSAAQSAQSTADGKITAYYLDSAPATAEIGDLWYDTDDKNKPYWWDGSAWVNLRDGTIADADSKAQGAQDTADSALGVAGQKSQTYYSDTAPWDDGDPTHDSDSGDLWYNTTLGEDGLPLNTPSLWVVDGPGGTSRLWINVTDPKIDLLSRPGDLSFDSGQTLGDVVSIVENTAETATSAQNMASTADGRVSISDYDPEGADVAYYGRDLDGNLLTGPEWGITAVSLSSGLATLTYESSPSVGVGEWIVVKDVKIPGDEGTGTPDTPLNQFNGEWLVNSNDGTSVTFEVVGEPDVPLTSVTGTGYDSVLLRRIEGSVWYTRTRARTNYCTNPSFEVNKTGWTDSNTTSVRVSTSVIEETITGSRVLEITNGASGSPSVSWLGVHVINEDTGATDPYIAVSPDEEWSASVFAMLQSGSGQNCFMSLDFHDASGALLTTVVGIPVDIVAPETDPETGESLAPDWRRITVHTKAPENAAFLGKVSVHNPNFGDVWRIDGVLLEQDWSFGRYFDGRSYDASWAGAEDASESILEGGKIVSIYELYNGGWTRLDFTGTTQYDADAGDLTKGFLNPDRIPEDAISVYQMRTNQVIASESLSAGDFVNIFSNDGLFMVRRANASGPYEAHGFVLDNASSGASVKVHTSGYNPLCSDLVPGNQFLSSTDGKPTHSPPTKAGRIIQRIGFASDETTLHFDTGISIKLI